MRDHEPTPDIVRVRAMLDGVLDGRISREQAADWPADWVDLDDAVVEDFEAWNGLMLLSAIDLLNSPAMYLYGTEDLLGWRRELGEDEAGVEGEPRPSIVVRHTPYDEDAPFWEYALLRWYETLSETEVEARRLMLARRPGSTSRYFARSVPPAVLGATLDIDQDVVVVARSRRRRDDELPDQRIDLLEWHHDVETGAEVRRLETVASPGAQHFFLFAVSAAAQRADRDQRRREASLDEDGES